MRFDKTEQARIEGVIDSNVQLPRVGRVVSVNARTSSGDVSNHEADVKWPPGQAVEQYRDVPVSQSASGFAYVPRVGDLVLLQFLNGNGERPIVTDMVYGSAQQDRAPLGPEGIIRGKRGDKYVELHPDGNWARIAKKSGDEADPDIKVEITDSGINIEASGDVTVSADNVVIDEGGTAEPVARQDHTHPESGGGTTGTPNESGTDTEIQ